MSHMESETQSWPIIALDETNPDAVLDLNAGHVVIGGTQGSGKSNMLRLIRRAASNDDRIVIVETVNDALDSLRMRASFSLTDVRPVLVLLDDAQPGDDAVEELLRYAKAFDMRVVTTSSSSSLVTKDAPMVMWMGMYGYGHERPGDFTMERDMRSTSGHAELVPVLHGV